MDAASLLELIGRPSTLYAALAGLLGCLAGLLAARLLAAGREARESGAPAAGERDLEARDLRRTLYLLQNENTKLSTFLMTLPDLARQLNSSVERRRIPQLLIQFIDGLFEAEQVLIFLTGPSGGSLRLAAAKGLPEETKRLDPVPSGKGRVGWVAAHQITMDENDFNLKSRSAMGDLSRDLHPAFRTELCAPMVMSPKGEGHDRTLGVISIGGLRGRPKNEKNMLKMVADLGSIAIQNTLLLNMIQESANTDGLTELANKRHFMARFADEILKAGKAQQCCSLFLFDIDHFKIYNDTNGHVAGDDALKITGRLLRDSLRDDDLPARYGGEEFVVLLPDTDKQGAAVVAEKIRKAIEAFAYPMESSQPGGRVTISGGVATWPYDAKNMAELVRCADQALYKGKREGRNCVRLFEPTYLSEETGATDIPRAERMETRSE